MPNGKQILFVFQDHRGQKAKAAESGLQTCALIPVTAILSAILGIDVAKNKFDVALLSNGKYKTKSFDNKPAGFASLAAWLEQRDVANVYACMESTGTYGDCLYPNLSVAKCFF